MRLWLLSFQARRDELNKEAVYKGGRDAGRAPGDVCVCVSVSVWWGYDTHPSSK